MQRRMSSSSRARVETWGCKRDARSEADNPAVDSECNVTPGSTPDGVAVLKFTGRAYHGRINRAASDRRGVWKSGGRRAARRALKDSPVKLPSFSAERPNATWSEIDIRCAGSYCLERERYDANRS